MAVVEKSFSSAAAHLRRDGAYGGRAAAMDDVPPRQALTRVLQYVPCARVQQLRLVSRRWDEACREHLRRVFESLLDAVKAKRKFSEAECLPACHWYSYSVRGVQYCLLTLHSKIESRFGKFSDSVTIPGIILDQVREIFRYIDDIPITHELPSDEIYDKVRNLHLITSSAIGNLGRVPEQVRIDPKPSLTKHDDCLESGGASKSSYRGNSSCKNLAVASGTASENRKMEAQPPITSLRTSDPSKCSTKQQSCINQAVTNNVPRGDHHKLTETVHIRKLKRPPTKSSEVSSTRFNVTDSEVARVSELLVSVANNQMCKQTIGDLRKEIENLSNRLKESEARNSESSWKCCTLLSELTSCKNEINQLRSKSTSSSSSSSVVVTQGKHQQETESPSVVAGLRKQIRDARRKLEENETQLAEMKQKNSMTERKLAKCERELACWRLFQRRDTRGSLSLTKRTTRTCVIRKTIREYDEKLETCQRRTRSLTRQYDTLFKKFKHLTGQGSAADISSSMVVDSTRASVRGRVVSKDNKRTRNEVIETEQQPMKRCRSTETVACNQQHGKRQRKTKHLNDSEEYGEGKKKTKHSEEYGKEQRKQKQLTDPEEQRSKSVKRKKTTTSEIFEVPKKSRNSEKERSKDTCFISQKSLHQNSSFSKHGIEFCDIVGFGSGTLDDMEVKCRKIQNRNESLQKPLRPQFNEGLKRFDECSVSCQTNNRGRLSPCTNIRPDRKNESYPNCKLTRIQSFQEGKCMKHKSTSNSEIQSFEHPRTQKNNLNFSQDSVNSCKVGSKSGEFESSLRNIDVKMKRSVHVEPVCFGQHAMLRGNLKGFQDARLSGFSCPAEDDANCLRAFLWVNDDKAEEPDNGNSSTRNHALQKGTLKGFQVPTHSCQSLKTRSNVGIAEREHNLIMEDDVRRSLESSGKDTNTMMYLHPYSETCKYKEVLATNFSKQPSVVSSPRENIKHISKQPSVVASPRENINHISKQPSAIASPGENTKNSVATSAGNMKLMQSCEREVNLKLDSFPKSQYKRTLSVARPECHSLSRDVQEPQVELTRLRLNPEIEINVTVDETHFKQEKNLEEAPSAVVSSSSEEPAPPRVASRGVGERVWSSRLRPSDCRPSSARTIRLKRRAPVTSEATAAVAGPM